MAKPKCSPKKRRVVPKATERAPRGRPRGRPRKTRGGMPQSPSRVVTEGRIKQEVISQGHLATRRWESDEEEFSGEFNDESDEESMSDELMRHWATVNLRHGRQVQELAHILSDDVDQLIPPLVRNLHVHSSLSDVNDWSPPLTTNDILIHYGKNVADILTKAGMLQCLAIDTTLVAAGWLADSAARPKRVMLLEDTTDLGRSCAMSTCPQVFEKATHVVVEPDWVLLRRSLPHPRALFPSLQYCCIQVDAALPTSDTTVSLVQELLRVRRLERLVVCMLSGCSRDAPVWKALQELTATEDKLRVLPHRFSIKAEWKAMRDDTSTVFNVPLVELQKKTAAINNEHREEYSELEPDIGAWRFKPPSMQVALSDAALDREASPYGMDWLGTSSSDVVAVGVDDTLVIPGMQTAEEDLRDMMQRHVGGQLFS